MQTIQTLAADLGLAPDLLHPYGKFTGKIDLALLERERVRPQQGRLILVSAITPTRAGLGKTTTTIGLGDALRRRGRSVCLALREPSLGPCFGVKGGGTGGGLAQLYPADRINLHFTGDFHAITAAHNLLAAVIDNHLHFGNELGVEPRTLLWPRVLDMNDRALRDVTIGLGGEANGVPRETRFDITAASELMAILCLAGDAHDLRRRIDRIVVAFDREGGPVTAADFGVTGAMMALLSEARMPNLVQTLEGTPAVVHGGPFANIAHGCNSVVATRCALQLADWVLTEAGFGFDLGAEKFFDIKCRQAGLETAAVVLVASVRALKMHAGVALSELANSDPGSVAGGISNLEKHVESIARFGQRPVVAINRYETDSEEELAVVRSLCAERGLPCAVSEHHARGGAGAEELAALVEREAQQGAQTVRYLYELEDEVPDKIEKVAREMYGARDVAYTKRAERDLRDIERLGLAGLPICIAKTPSSLSDDPKLHGRPRDFEVLVRGLQLNAGAGFLVVLTGDILRMPGLPRRPRALDIDMEGTQIVGLS